MDSVSASEADDPGSTPGTRTTFRDPLIVRLTDSRPLQDELVKLLDGRQGHFLMESGYHSEHWFELDRLLAQRDKLQPFVKALARQLAAHPIDALCGPATGGAELAVRIGAELNLPAYHTERFEPPNATGFFPVRYLVPAGQRAALSGKRVAIADDAISAGSAVKGTYADLIACGARPVVCGALFVFGPAADAFTAEKNLKLESIAHLPFNLWKPNECPLCQAGMPLEKISDATPLA